MNLLKTIWRLFRSLGQRRAVKQEIDEDLRFHIEQRMAENMAAGMSAQEAAVDARKRFGNIQTVREQCREARGASFGETAIQDIRFGLRMLRKNPGFTAVAVLTLALGIGANTAIFSFINAVLLKPLPYRHADRLVRVASVNPTLGLSDSRSSDLNIADWQDRSTLFEELAAFQEWDGVLTIAGRSETVRVNWATPNLLSILGAQPVLGRLLLESDVKVTNAGVLLPYGVWERFGGDVAIIGKTISLDGETGTVVGILPPKVAAPGQGAPPLDQVFLGAKLQDSRWPRDLQLRNVIGRLKAGVTVAQAQEELSRIAAQLEREFPATNRGWGVRLADLKSWETAPVRGQLLAVYGATIIILLIACLNVSNLLLIRGESRRKELAIRAALGSTRLRMVRQLLSESLILSFAGAAAGVILAVGCRKALVAFAPDALGIGQSRLDWPVLVSALCATLVAALLSGLFPALRLSRGDLNRTLAEAGRSASPGKGRHRLLNALVIGQIAISTALLLAAGLAIVSFRKLLQADPGFAKHNTICFRVEPFTKAAPARLVLERLSQLPGVQSVGAANIELFNDVFSDGMRISAENSAAPGGLISGTVDLWNITPDYFSAAGIPLLAGRDFTAQDGGRVVIVNDSLAKRFFPNQEALGKSIRVPWTNSAVFLKRIIGVVGSVKHRGLRQPEVPIMYWRHREEDMESLALMVRTLAGPSAMVPVMRDAIRKVDPALVMSHVATTQEVVERSLSGDRFAALLMSGFAALAMLLAALGLYGVMSYSVSQRTQEIGVRMALGAERRAVLGMVLRQGMALAAAGIVAGLIAALALVRLMRNLLYNVSPTDPATLATITLLLCAVAFLASWLPARRAARTDPMTALRHE